MSLKHFRGSGCVTGVVFILSMVALWFWLPPEPRMRLSFPSLEQYAYAISTPSGDTVALNGRHEVTVWRADQQEKIAAVPGGPACTETWPWTFSPDGTHLATNYDADQLYIAVWKIPSGEQVLAIPQGNRHLTTTLFTPDGRTFVVLYYAQLPSDYRSVITAWDLASGQSRVVLSCPGFLPCLAMSPDGKTLAALRVSPSAILLWDFATGEERAQFRSDSQPRAVAFTPDGKKLLASYSDRTLRVWDIATGTEERVFPERTGWEHLRGIRFASKGDLVATEEILLWYPDLLTERLLPFLQWPVRGRRQVVVWDFHTGRKRTTLPPDYRLVAFDESGSTLMTYNLTGEIQWWDIPPRRPVARILAWSAAASAVTFCLVSLSTYLVRRWWAVES